MEQVFSQQNLSHLSFTVTVALLGISYIAKACLNIFFLFFFFFTLAPSTIIYDNCCNLHVYCLFRDPHFCKDTLLLIGFTVRPSSVIFAFSEHLLSRMSKIKKFSGHKLQWIPDFKNFLGVPFFQKLKLKTDKISIHFMMDFVSTFRIVVYSKQFKTW